MFTFRLLSKNVRIKPHGKVSLSVVLYGQENWYLRLREENMLTVIANRLLGTRFGPKRDEATGLRKKCIMNNFSNCIHRHILLEFSNQRIRDGQNM
jgi:hypothetical protein